MMLYVCGVCAVCAVCVAMVAILVQQPAMMYHDIIEIVIAIVQ